MEMTKAQIREEIARLSVGVKVQVIPPRKRKVKKEVKVRVRHGQ